MFRRTVPGRFLVVALLLCALSARAEPKPRVLLLGDSNMLGFFGRQLQARLVDQGFAVTRRAQHSSGLAFPKFWDWTHHGPIFAEQFAADVVVIILGGNDAQSMKPRPWDAWSGRIPWDREHEWSVEYKSRLRDLVDGLTAQHRRLVVLAPTNRRSPKARERMRRILKLQREVLADQDNVWWVDTFRLSSNRNGLYLAAGLDERGRFVRYRRGDGIHLTEEGAAVLLDRVFPELMRTAFADYAPL